MLLLKLGLDFSVSQFWWVILLAVVVFGPSLKSSVKANVFLLSVWYYVNDFNSFKGDPFLFAY